MKYRVLRGGSYLNVARRFRRSERRLMELPKFRSRPDGFRVVVVKRRKR